MQRFRALFLRGSLVFLVTLAACSSVYYSVWEKLGKEKRNLLRDNIEAVQDDQKDVAEEFKSALERLQAAYGSGGGDIEQLYNTLKADYERSSREADTLRARIKKVEGIASDLFTEWRSEADAMQNHTFRGESIRKLEDTKDRFEQMRIAMDRAEKGIDPVLGDLKDHMLMLKHSLNSQAISHLGRSEAAEIERGIRDLLRTMNESIRRADEFLGALGE